MKVCVVGLWHLGSVTAASLASIGHEVRGYDANSCTTADLNEARPPVFEPGLAELVAQQRAEKRLSFSSDAATALAEAEVVWVTYDTPVDDDDVADVESVVSDVESLFPHIRQGAVVLISSQLIAGCTGRLQALWDEKYPGKQVDFAYSPENLRLGKALEVFLDPDRVVVGVNNERAQSVLRELLRPFESRILWLSVESAEMTKHALNAFLAMCVSFANEIATICEHVGADAKEVERALKSEKRIGPHAYLAPGEAFAGGTLARDIYYLRQLAEQRGQASELFGAIKESNDRHRGWARRRLALQFPSLRGVRIAVLGLTYKPGTDTLRRSSSVELCRWLVEQGAQVVAHDPRVEALPPELAASVQLVPTVPEALQDARAIVIATPWPEYKTLSADMVRAATAQPVVLDASRIAANTLKTSGIDYVSVGTPASKHG
jgi:UDPglucose 6-dehydrogenase